MPSPYSSEGTQGDAPAWPNLGVRPARAPDRRPMTAYDELLAEAFAGREAGPHRGEPAGAHPRQPADGAVEQVRLARADDRQQVGDVGRLLDALRRHGRRLRGHQGRPQAAGLPARRAARRPRAAGSSAGHRDPPAVGRAAPDQRDEDSLPPYEVLDAILEGYVEQDLGRDQLVARGLPARTSSGSSGSSTWPSTSAASSPRDQDHQPGLRPRPAPADHQPLPGLSARTEPVPVALVTGADNPRGIGRACVRAWPPPASRSRARDAARRGPAGGGARRAADLADPAGPLLDAVDGALGPVTALVNNAAVSKRDGFERLDAATLDRHHAVNVGHGPAEPGPRRLRGRPGRIVSLTSGQALGPMPGELAYTATKGAIEASPANSRPVPRSRQRRRPGPDRHGLDGRRAARRARCAFRRRRRADAARLVPGVLTEAAWVTGQVIHSEGGRRA